MNTSFSDVHKYSSLNYSQILIIFITSVIWFTSLGYRDLIDPDEGRYAEIPREMVATGDWLTPKLNGLKYFEKPAMHYWMTATAYKLFGKSNATARLVSALSGFIVALWCLFIATKLTNVRIGYYSYLVCISSLLFIALGHLITLDMTLTLFLSLAMGALILAQHNRTKVKSCRYWMLFGYAMLAAGVLTKGLVSLLLPGATILLYSIIFRDWQIWRHLHLAKGTMLFLILCAPWFIGVSLVNPEFAEFFFIREHLQRYTSNIHERSQPIYFFIPILLLGATPWLNQCFKVLTNPKQLLSSNINQEDFFRPGTFSFIAFIWIYAVFTLFFFSLSHSKLVPYLLPIFPFIAILIAIYIDCFGIKKWDSLQLLVFSVLLAGAGLVLPYLDAGDIPKAPEAIARFQIMLGAVSLLLLLGSFLSYRWRHKSALTVAIFALYSLLGIKFLNWSYQDLGQYNSAKTMAAKMAPYLKETPNLPIYSVEVFQHSLLFYLNREITLVNYQGELAMGIEAEPEKVIKSVEQFIQLWSNLPQGIAIVEPKLLSSSAMKDLSYTIIYADVRKVAIVKNKLIEVSNLP